jgi:hypothetical protein
LLHLAWPFVSSDLSSISSEHERCTPLLSDPASKSIVMASLQQLAILIRINTFLGREIAELCSCSCTLLLYVGLNPVSALSLGHQRTPAMPFPHFLILVSQWEDRRPDANCGRRAGALRLTLMPTSSHETGPTSPISEPQSWCQHINDLNSVALGLQICGLPSLTRPSISTDAKERIGRQTTS